MKRIKDNTAKEFISKTKKTAQFLMGLIKLDVVRRPRCIYGTVKPGYTGPESNENPTIMNVVFWSF